MAENKFSFQIVAVRIGSGTEHKDITAVCIVDSDAGESKLVTMTELLEMAKKGATFCIIDSEGDAVAVVPVKNVKTEQRYVRSIRGETFRDDLLKLPKFK